MADQESSIRISMMMDNLNQMVLIFYLKSKLDEKGVRENLDCDKIAQASDAQGCSFKISAGPMTGEVNIIFAIPSYRLVS